MSERVPFPARDEARGMEWIVEAYGCAPAALCDVGALGRLFARLVDEIGLHPVAPATWHVFPGAGGITGLCALAESHLAVHTFPEHGALCLNLFCCRPRAEHDFAATLAAEVGAARAVVRRVDRVYGVAAEAGATR